MDIAGPEEYTNLVDVEAVTAYLRQRGISNKAIERLKIKVVENIIGSTMGLHIFGSRRVWLATWPMRQEGKSRKSIQALNCTLLHELAHFCDYRDWKVALPCIALIAVYAALISMIMYAAIRAINAFVNGIATQDVALAILWVIALPVTIKVLYWLSPFERRARRIEKSNIWLLKTRGKRKQ